MFFGWKKKNSRHLAKENDYPPNELLDTIEANIKQLNELMGTPIDFVSRYISIAGTDQKCGLVFLDDFCNKEIVNEHVIKCILSNEDKTIPSGKALLEYLKLKVIAVTKVEHAKNIDELFLSLLGGDTLLFVDGVKEALVLNTPSISEGRAIQEPVTEPLIRGPRDGFTESIRVNSMLIRNRVHDYNLRIETYNTGRRAKKKLMLFYINGIIHPELLKEVRRRLETLDIDDALESGIIEQWIEDSFLSPFPQVTSTERPDKVTAALLNGQFVILLDGTPFALIAPITITNTLHSPEDYYERWLTGTLLRLLRYGAALLTVFLPAAYIALVSFHPGMIPSHLAFSMASTREGVPFPSMLEAILMETTMELLREAGVRLPKPIGQTIGIVGGLVIGEAAVAAGIVSPIMVIVVAITAISSFSLPYYGLAISFRVLRFSTMLAAGMFGLYGIILVFILICIHLANLQSFGIPYTAPIAPTFFGDWKEAVIRAPITMLGKRYKYLQPRDRQRLSKKRGN